MLRVHETSLTWKDNANLCTPKHVAKNNDRAASVVALVHTRAHGYPRRSCDSFNQLAKTRLVATLARAHKRRHLG